ncbi:MAG: hypothetical protein PSN34_09290 [Urechidicola sp.]|nr:hypothetical protein [Urechidicola sp.]
MTFEDWENQSKNNNRLLPKYGGVEKTKEEIKADKAFTKEIMASFKSKSKASNHMIELGFKYLYRGDLKTAMYRYNQAFLLDKNNSNIYWGYGAIYMAFGEFDLSRAQYEEGLKMNPKNDNILIDFGTSYLGEFYNLYEVDKIKSQNKLDSAIKKLKEAYDINSLNSNASYKLSICYLYKNDCEKAKHFLEVSVNLDNKNITESYKNELNLKCETKNIDCASIKIGKFKIEDEISGLTEIERYSNFQIEENKKYGYKLKLQITWLDNCTYQLKPIEGLLNPENKNLPKMVLTCKIIAITENGYIQTSSSNIDKTVLTKEVIKVE